MWHEKNIKTKLISIILSLLVVCSGLAVVFTVSGTNSRMQPGNALEELESGVGAGADDHFGWNVSSAGDLNGDIYDDLIVGAPGNDTGGLDAGAVYIFYGRSTMNLVDINASNADVIITGTNANDRFGWDVGGGGDVDGDGVDDVIVGAPGASNNQGRVYLFFGGTMANGTSSDADVLLNGTLGTAELFGHSVDGAGDFNSDTYDDVIIGAPGSDRAYIFLGALNLQTLFINLWDTDGDEATPETDFTSGLNSSANTPDPTGANDGWDWYLWNISGVYGGDDSAVEYNADPDRDNVSADSTVDVDEELIISIGEDHGDGSDGGGTGDSGAYGLELQITAQEYALISAGGTAKLSFDWAFDDIGNLNPDEEAWVKCRFGDTSTMNYLGSDLDSGDNNADGTNEIWWADSPYSVGWTSFSSDVSSYITAAGSYYLDFGGKLRNWGGMGPNENGIYHFDNVGLKISNLQEPIIFQGTTGTAFGSSVAGLGEFNGGALMYDDVAVGAPLTTLGSTYLFYGGPAFPSPFPAANADFELNGIQVGELFGWSIAGPGDINDDTSDDIIIGAPGGDRAYIYYGRTGFTTPTPLYADLWDDNAASPNVVDFSVEVSNTGSDVNTFGRNAGDDGWDWADDVYGTPTPAVDFEYQYAAWEAGGADADGTPADNSSRIEIQLGPSHQNSDDLPPGGGGTWPDTNNPGGNDWYAGAWGVEFNLTTPIYNTLQLGGSMEVDFDWEAVDTEYIYNQAGGTEEDCYIKSRISNMIGSYYLGPNAGGAIPGPTVFFETTGSNGNPWGPDYGHFNWDVTQFIDSSGPYYLDFGCAFGGGNQAGTEGMRAYFDNITVTIYPRLEQDIIINGTPGDMFGFSVSGAGRLNTDNYIDIIIGAPGTDTVNGVDSGAIFVFLSNGSLNTTLDAAIDSDMMNYGEAFNDSFGRAVAHAGSIDGDAYSEVLVGAPYTDLIPSTPLINDTGKSYVLTLLKRPDIKLNYPVGGEILNGEIMINATAIDPDDNIDALGVKFYYSTDMVTWTLIGNDSTSGMGMYYELLWNTTQLNDSTTYYIKVNVSDVDLNLVEDISGAFTVDNQHPPLVNILNPFSQETLSGVYPINATGIDDPRDQIGGGVNLSIGVRFYYSDDNLTWIYIGNDTTPAPTDLYQIDLDTTIMVDGYYWLKANITDIEDMVAEDIVEFIIGNPERPPAITLLAPVNVTEVKGTIDINATAFDLDGNINSTGVSFYYSTDGVNWVLINNDPTPDIDFYTISWDTTTVQDGYYWVKAFVNDTTNLSASAISDILMVHNNLMNPPTVTVIAPNNGDEIRVNFVLKAEAFDIDDNLDTTGVTFYYSADKIDWIYIGNTPIPEVGSTILYTLPWNTLQIPDGRYWLNASASDTTNLTGWDHSDEPFFIHNSQLNSPILLVDYPNGGETLTGTATIRAGAGDLENNIDVNGVRFYYSSNMVNWTLIDKSPSPSSLTPISDILLPYELLWDTTAVPDGVYWLKAEATDTHNLTGFDLSDDPFLIHNSDQNAPIVVVVYPNGGEEVNGSIMLESTCFDLEDNVDANGVTFYYSSDDKQTWTMIDNQVTGDLFTVNPFDKLYQLSWNTTTVPDGYYWLKSSATDLTSLIGNDTSDDYFIIHNDLNNPPIINIIQPLENDIVSSDVEIQVEVTDLENNIQEVSFYYSEDNVDWVLIGTDTEPDGDIYSFSWNSAEIFDGEYYLRVVATDTDGNSAEALSGKIDVNNGITKPGKDDKTDDLSEYWWLWILVAIIIILLILFALVYQKKRKEEQMEKTLASMSPQAIPIKGAPGSLEEGEPKPALAASASPKLLPPTGAGEGEDAGKDFEQKLVTWKSQGYNVSRLESLIDTDMEAFWNVLPIFINNINKLNELKPRFNALDTTGYENEAESIRTKINEPDQALAVEQEVIMLEDLIGQQKKLEDEEATEGAITKEEEAKADFDAFLPTGEEGEAPVGEPSEEEAAAEQELEGELKEAEDEISPEDEEELDAAEAELEGEVQAADEEIAEEKGEGEAEAEPDQEPSEPSEGQETEDVEDDEEDNEEMDF